MTTPKFELPHQPQIPYDVEVLVDPSQGRLRELALEHTPFCTRTADGSINKIARNKSRVAEYTYVIDRHGDPAAFSHQTIPPDRAQALIDAQAQYIARAGKLVAIHGYVGLGAHAVPVEWLYTLEGSNIAGMQQVLAFPRSRVESTDQRERPFQPAFRLVYTPDFFPDMPGRQAIVVDLDEYRTYIMGPDYFGESKKGALRMLAQLHYHHGGLVMHAGAKAIQLHDHSLTMGILGLSGTGKTTTTFSRQGERTQPVQDDMIALWPGGSMTVTENGCFAKTFGLTDETEPVIYRGTRSEAAWIENVYVDEKGRVDFAKGQLAPAEVARLRDVLIGTGANAERVDAYAAGKVAPSEVITKGIPNDGWDFVIWSENGRSIIPMSSVESAADLQDLPRLRSLGILNRDEGKDAAMPGIVRFTSPAQAAAYFMLGETTKTSAAGKSRGKTRSPFTQPFFPLAHHLQAARFSELAATFPATSMWLMNTGYVGGGSADVQAGTALKIKIPHSSAMLEALIEDRIKWTRDPDFGYEVVDLDAPENASLLERVPRGVLQPRRWFEDQGRGAEYRGWVERMKSERRAFLEKFAVAPAIVRAVSG
jgi:phosphoenolpyruvate carboxykinase (ATP)